ncbi:hypothetical protein HYV81_04250 [Candidatus Woesearchaeota archaeon]|nr:hypothetical protein [Candidatus Woesearchaeota archaeon]
MERKNLYKGTAYLTIVPTVYSAPIQVRPSASAKLVLLNRPHGRLVMEDGVRRWENRRAGSDSVDIILHSVSSNYSGNAKISAGKPLLERIADSTPSQYESEDAQQQYPRAA